MRPQPCDRALPLLTHACVRKCRYGHPKSTDLPVFGAKVIACYECTLDIHGAPQVAWTELATTAMPGDTAIHLTEPVQWPVGSKVQPD